MSSAGTRCRKALVFDIDGVRWDKLREAETPNLDALATEGRLGPTLTHDPARFGAGTVSGPGHSNIVTGVWPDKHQVTDNLIDPNQLARYPDFLTRLRAVRPELSSFALGDWPPLINQIIGTPSVKVLEPYSDGVAADLSSTRRIADRAIEALSNDDADVGYVYFLHCDHVAHQFGGASAAYLNAISEVDGAIGAIMAAVRARPGHADENWLFIAATDHGHLDAGGHGGSEPEVRQIWTLAAGGDIQAIPPSGLAGMQMVDIVPTVFSHLGVAIDPDWGLDGTPLTPVRAASK